LYLTRGRFGKNPSGQCNGGILVQIQRSVVLGPRAGEAHVWRRCGAAAQLPVRAHFFNKLEAEKEMTLLVSKHKRKHHNSGTI